MTATAPFPQYDGWVRLEHRVSTEGTDECHASGAKELRVQDIEEACTCTPFVRTLNTRTGRQTISLSARPRKTLPHDLYSLDEFTMTSTYN